MTSEPTAWLVQEVADLLDAGSVAFEYLPNGGGDVCEKLAAKVIQLGGEIRFKSRVMRVEKNNGDWIAHWERDGLSGADHAPFLIIASDSPSAGSIIKNSFPR